MQRYYDQADLESDGPTAFPWLVILILISIPLGIAAFWYVVALIGEFIENRRLDAWRIESNIRWEAEREEREAKRAATLLYNAEWRRRQEEEAQADVTFLKTVS